MSQDADELGEVLESVYDEETFLQFLLALRDDRESSIELEQKSPSSPYGADAMGWENTTIERFLDTAVRWARDSVNGNSYLHEAGQSLAAYRRHPLLGEVLRVGFADFTVGIEAERL